MTTPRMPWRERAADAAARRANAGAAASAEQAQKMPVLLEAWIAQRTEWTKSVFAMSSAAVALLAAALLSQGAQDLLPFTKTVLVLSSVSFGVAAAACLGAFKQSAKALEQHMAAKLDKEAAEATETELKRIESLQLHGFAFGLGLLFIAAFLEHALRS